MPLELLDRYEWLRLGTWFAHCTEVAYEEAAYALWCMQCAIVRVQRCDSATKSRVDAGRKARANVGVDGSASNDSGSLLSNLGFAATLHRVDTGNHPSPATGCHPMTPCC